MKNLKLKAARVAKDLSQSDLAQLVGDVYKRQDLYLYYSTLSSIVWQCAFLQKSSVLCQISLDNFTKKQHGILSYIMKKHPRFQAERGCFRIMDAFTHEQLFQCCGKKAG